MAALRYYNFSVCIDPAYATSIVMKTSDAIPATDAIPSSVPCRKPSDVGVSAVDIVAEWIPPVVATTPPGRWCMAVDPAWACFKGNATLFLSMSTRWNAQYPNGTFVSPSFLNETMPRTVNTNLTLSTVRNGTAPEAECRAFGGETTATASGTATVTATATTVSSSKPASGPRETVKIWQQAVAVVAAAVAVGPFLA